MKLLLTGDWHLRYRRPEMRLDEDYFGTQAGKVEQILGIAREKDCSVVLQPGDFFDGIETPWMVVQYYIKIFRKGNVDVLCVAGQHDMRYHTRDIENTPLGVLNAANAVYLNWMMDWGGRATIYASWWGGDIPLVYDSKKTKIEVRPAILLMHRMVVQRKLWLGQTDFVYARDLLRGHPEFDLFVTGDNHKAFVEELDGRYVVNCGSLMRSAVDQVDHRPRVYVYDTESRGLEEIFLDVRPAEEVLDVGRAEAVRERDEKLELFVEELRKRQTGGDAGDLDFVDRLYEAMSDRKVDEGIRDIVEEALRG